MHNKIFVKPNTGSYGKGIRIIEINNNTNLEELYDELKKEECIVEEVITQHTSLANFNPSSVNTLRLMTILGEDDKVKVLAACLRMGNGKKYADNFHHGGISALVDVKTGIVNSVGMDGNFHRYILHPRTGTKIVGFQIPSWDRVIQCVTKAARLLPSVRHIGWDIAILENGEPIIIEGNSKPGFYALQTPDQIGKWPLYKEYF